MKGMKAPGGKDGFLRRMYHPRFGLWIVQQTVLLGSCYIYQYDSHSNITGLDNTHNNVLDNFMIR